MISVVWSPLEALEMIYTGRFPCRKCGKPHKQGPPRNGFSGSWANPDDGHIYYPMKAKDLAKVVLDDQRGR